MACAKAFMNVVLTLMDNGGRAVLFAPYYFNHLMALQMTGHDITIADCDEHMMPDLEKLRTVLAKGDVRMVVICTPCNPTGVVVRSPEPDTARLYAPGLLQIGRSGQVRVKSKRSGDLSAVQHFKQFTQVPLLVMHSRGLTACSRCRRPRRNWRKRQRSVRNTAPGLWWTTPMSAILSSI